MKVFGLRDAMLISGEENIYSCEYSDNYKWIIHIESEHSFTMEGGILKYGILNLISGYSSYHFCIIRGVTAYFNMRYIDIIFISKMNSLIYLEGGTLCFEYIRIENETNYWIFPLIDIPSIVSSSVVKLFSLHITNSQFIQDNSSGHASVLYYHSPNNVLIFSLILNCSFLHLSNNSLIGGEMFTGMIFRLLCYSYETGLQ